MGCCQLSCKACFLDLKNRLEYKPAPTQETHEKVTNSRPENDLEWPKEALTIADITKRNDIRKKYGES